MSLVYDNALRRLWEEAQKTGSHEWASVAFWNHLFSKYIFKEKNWVISPEAPLADNDQLRRVDLVLKYLGSNDFEVLCFHELKRTSATSTDIEAAETQVYAACQAYLARHGMPQVYGITTFGTKARVWQCSADVDYLNPMFGSDGLADASDYIEANSTDAQTLMNAFDHMKRFPLTARKGIDFGVGDQDPLTAQEIKLTEYEDGSGGFKSFILDGQEYRISNGEWTEAIYCERLKVYATWNR